MDVVYTLVMTLAFIPWALDARDAWRRRRIVRHEMRSLERELDHLN